MTSIIAVANNKGGTGKTTVSVQGAFYTALKLNKKTLFIDMDAQGNGTSTLLPGVELTGTSTVELFMQELPEPLHVQTSAHGIDVIGVRPYDLKGYETESLSEEQIINPMMHLADIIPDYDYVWIDCPPNFGRRFQAALMLAEFVLCPIRLSGYAIDGLKILTDAIDRIRVGGNDSLRLLGVVINAFDKTSAKRKAFELLEEAIPGMIFKSKIYQRGPIDTASLGDPIWKVPNGKAAFTEFEGVYKEMIRRINKINKENKAE